MFRRKRRSLARVSLLPNPFPFEQRVRTASGLDARTALATIERHIFLPAAPTCIRSCDFQIDANPATYN
jgi:hypothetical protein